MRPTLVGVPFYRQVSHFLCKLVLCRIFFQTFMEVGQRALGVLGALDLPLHSMPCSKPHSCSCALLYCAYLQELEQVWPGKVVSCSHTAPCSSHTLFFPMGCYYEQLLSVIANSPWLAAQPSGYRARDTHTSPSSSDILQGGSAQR